MNKMITKTLLAAAVTTALGVFSSGAMAQTAFPDFTVNEGSVLGANKATFTADKITGNYVEVITFDQTKGTFDVSLKWNAGQFVANNGKTTLATQLSGGTGGDANQYGLYALYSGSGTFSGSGTATTFNFNKGGSLQIFLDPNTDTTFNEPATGNLKYTTGSSGDDIEIVNGVPTFGKGTLDPALSTCSDTGGINCGSFGATASIALTDAGKTYFTAPNPFYNVSFQSGQLNNFNPTGTQVINGSLDVIFAVPEPTSVALIGLGLLGLGLSRRRKQQA